MITEIARSLLASVDTTGGVRLLGVGVAGLTDVLQDELFELTGRTTRRQAQRTGFDELRARGE